jgi:hypothetical protein
MLKHPANPHCGGDVVQQHVNWCKITQKTSFPQKILKKN